MGVISHPHCSTRIQRPGQTRGKERSPSEGEVATLIQKPDCSLSCSRIPGGIFHMKTRYYCSPRLQSFLHTAGSQKPCQLGKVFIPWNFPNPPRDLKEQKNIGKQPFIGDFFFCLLLEETTLELLFSDSQALQLLNIPNVITVSKLSYM